MQSFIDSVKNELYNQLLNSIDKTFGIIDDNGSSVPRPKTIAEWEAQQAAGIVYVKRGALTNFPPDDLTIDEWVRQVEEARKAREARELRKKTTEG